MIQDQGVFSAAPLQLVSTIAFPLLAIGCCEKRAILSILLEYDPLDGDQRQRHHDQDEGEKDEGARHLGDRAVLGHVHVVEHLLIQENKLKMTFAKTNVHMYLTYLVDLALLAYFRSRIVVAFLLDALYQTAVAQHVERQRD